MKVILRTNYHVADTNTNTNKHVREQSIYKEEYVMRYITTFFFVYMPCNVPRNNQNYFRTQISIIVENL